MADGKITLGEALRRALRGEPVDPTQVMYPGDAATRDGHFARLNEEADAVLEDRKPRICPLCLYPAGDLRCKCWETTA